MENKGRPGLVLVSFTLHSLGSRVPNVGLFHALKSVCPARVGLLGVALAVLLSSPGGGHQSSNVWVTKVEAN